jgi:hypothetical protein
MTTRIVQTLADLLVGAFFRLDFWAHKSPAGRSLSGG